MISNQGTPPFSCFGIFSWRNDTSNNENLLQFTHKAVKGRQTGGNVRLPLLLLLFVLSKPSRQVFLSTTAAPRPEISIVADDAESRQSPNLTISRASASLIRGDLSDVLAVRLRSDEDERCLRRRVSRSDLHRANTFRGNRMRRRIVQDQGETHGRGEDDRLPMSASVTSGSSECTAAPAPELVRLLLSDRRMTSRCSSCCRAPSTSEAMASSCLLANLVR